MILKTLILSIITITISSSIHSNPRDLNRIKQMDSNENGEISYEEFNASALDRFTLLDTNGDGIVTGKIKGDIIDGERKAEILKEIAKIQNLSLDQVIAVGDGANDLPMLNIAGLGIAFRAKQIVKASAQQAISNAGLDGILYLLGYSDKDISKLHPN